MIGPIFRLSLSTFCVCRSPRLPGCARRFNRPSRWPLASGLFRETAGIVSLLIQNGSRRPDRNGKNDGIFRFSNKPKTLLSVSFCVFPFRLVISPIFGCAVSKPSKHLRPLLLKLRPRSRQPLSHGVLVPGFGRPSFVTACSQLRSPNTSLESAQ